MAAQLRQADSLLLSNLHQRIGATPAVTERMSWGRVIEARTDIQQDGQARIRSKGNFTGLQLGSDVWNEHNWHLGGYLGYVYGDVKVNGFASGINDHVGKNTVHSYFLGLYGTYTNDQAAYVDIVLQGSHHRVDIKPNGNPDSRVKGHGLTASLEAGKPFVLGSSKWQLEPQAQIVHQWLNLDDQDISGQTTVKQSHNDKWLFRLGARMQGTYAIGKGVMHPYARVNVFYSPNGADRSTYRTEAATTTLSAGASHTSTELAIGGSYRLSDKVSAYGEIGHTWSNSGKAKVKAPVSGSVGLKINW